MGRKSVKMSSSDSSTPFSTGLFGNLHAGSIVSCKADDNSFFCNLTKVFNGLLMIIGILLILYFVYYFAKIFLFNKKK
jgi:hypothetical protein